MKELKARTLGGKLKELRDDKQMSQVEVAKHLGILQETYSRWEKDKVKQLNSEILQKLAVFYGVTVQQLTTNEYELDHLPKELQEFVRDPRAKAYLIDSFVNFKQDELKGNIRQA